MKKLFLILGIINVIALADGTAIYSLSEWDKFKLAFSPKESDMLYMYINKEEDSKFIELIQKGVVGKDEAIKYAKNKESYLKGLKEDYIKEFTANNYSGSLSDYIANRKKTDNYSNDFFVGEGSGTKEMGELKSFFSTASKNNKEPGVFDSLENFTTLIDNASEIAFGVVDAAGTAASSSLAVLGTLPTIMGTGVPGASSAANTVQTILLKLNQVKARIDALKQYKRVIENMKGLSKADLKTLAGVNNALNGLQDTINSSLAFKDGVVDFEKYLRTDLFTKEGWEKSLEGESIVKNRNKEVLDLIAGEKAESINNIIDKSKKLIRGMKGDTEKQNLQKLNEQLTLLTTIMEKFMSNQAALSTKEIMESNKKLDEEIASKKIRQEQMEELKEEAKKLRDENKNSELGKKFIGDVLGGK